MFFTAGEAEMWATKPNLWLQRVRGVLLRNGAQEHLVLRPDNYLDKEGYSRLFTKRTLSSLIQMI